MRFRLQPRWPLWLALLGFAGAVMAQSAPITSQLQVEQVQMIDGKTVLKPAQATRPGDVLEYQVSYTNHSASPVSGLIANLPIPAGTTLLDRSQLPPDALASTDGAHFAALPLMRTVRQPDGSERREAVPLEDYRALRWNLGTLAAGKSEQVSARVRVSSALPAGAATSAKPTA